MSQSRRRVKLDEESLSIRATQIVQRLLELRPIPGLINVSLPLFAHVYSQLTERFNQQLTVRLYPTPSGLSAYIVELPFAYFDIATSLGREEVAFIDDCFPNKEVRCADLKTISLRPVRLMLNDLGQNKKMNWRRFLPFVAIGLLTAVGLAPYSSTSGSSHLFTIAPLAAVVASLWLAVFGIYSGLAQSSVPQAIGSRASNSLGHNWSADRTLLSWILTAIMGSILGMLIAALPSGPLEVILGRLGTPPAYASAASTAILACLAQASVALSLAALMPPLTDTLSFLVERQILDTSFAALAADAEDSLRLHNKSQTSDEPKRNDSTH